VVRCADDVTYCVAFEASSWFDVLGERRKRSTRGDSCHVVRCADDVTYCVAFEASSWLDVLGESRKRSARGGST
jgi:hypothetical protein